LRFLLLLGQHVGILAVAFALVAPVIYSMEINRPLARTPNNWAELMNLLINTEGYIAINLAGEKDSKDPKCLQLAAYPLGVLCTLLPRECTHK